MTDRTETKPRRTTNNAPIPMPGRLAVDFYDNLLKAQKQGPLDQQRPGTAVTATGRITLVKPLDSGRVHVVLTDTDKNSALIDFGPSAADKVWPLLKQGARLTVAGHVTGARPLVPAGIAGYDAQIAGAR
ncbi:hypothetical protein [Actinacidiphila acididurans]|uniref:OB-fold nucleic acid binding domain protein n=1 Tax=Actinacidiphila acididurans TaxID=2784346 RepID=A0ABS2U2Y1_9ACTN|nr:hypothetical protein [Actinacidiphila acididurans]MBM9509950.1 hypothetical protein [Actinacidiphila acididurans]